MFYQSISHNKASCADRVKPSLAVIYNIWALLTLSSERQSAQMSKITNYGLTRSAQDAL